MPTANEVIAFLTALTNRQKAEEYVRKAPSQIMTPYRAHIEAALGWRDRPFKG